MKQTKIHKTNQLKSLLALTKASLIASFRNPTSLFFNFFFPFIFISIFGLLGNSGRVFEIGIREQSLQKGPIYEILQKIDSIKLVTEKSNLTLDDELKKGQIPVVIEIKEIQHIQAGFPLYELKIEKSAADPQNAEAIANILNSIVQSINNPENGQAKMINVSTETIEGRKYKQIDFILPGQLSFALLSNALFGISITLISLKKQLVLKRIFATPVNKFLILLAEALAKMVMALLQTLIIILLGYFAFGFTLAEGIITVISLVILSLIGIFMFMAFGLLVSTLGKTEDSVAPIANLIMMPQLFLSGAFFPIEAFPEFLQPIAKILPMTFLNDAFRSVAFEGNSITTTLPQIAGLLVWAVIVYAIVAKRFKWE